MKVKLIDNLQHVTAGTTFFKGYFSTICFIVYTPLYNNSLVYQIVSQLTPFIRVATVEIVPITPSSGWGSSAPSWCVSDEYASVYWQH